MKNVITPDTEFTEIMVRQAMDPTKRRFRITGKRPVPKRIIFRKSFGIGGAVIIVAWVIIFERQQIMDLGALANLFLITIAQNGTDDVVEFTRDCIKG